MDKALLRPCSWLKFAVGRKHRTTAEEAKTRLDVLIDLVDAFAKNFSVFFVTRMGLTC